MAAALRRTELVAALSVASDLGMGQPMGHAHRCALLTVVFGQRLGLSARELQDSFDLALLRSIGCNAAAADAGAIFGDDLAFAGWVSHLDHGKPAQVAAAMLRHVGEGESAVRRLRALARAFTGFPTLLEGSMGHCEVAKMLAERMGYSPRVQTLLGQVYERFDGKGLPRRLKGRAIELPARVVALVRLVEIFHRLGGRDAVRTVLGERSGGELDPDLASSFTEHLDACLDAWEVPSIWEAMLAAEPSPGPPLDSDAIDQVLRAMAEFVDLRSPFTHCHSTGVALLAKEAARRLGLDAATVTLVERAAWVHDLGLTGVPAGLHDSPGRLDEAGWERLRLHPYYTERILQRPSALAELAEVATLAHERLDGAGYHRRLAASAITIAGRVLAAADAYHAMTEARPHRAALTRDDAARELRHEAELGRLDRSAVEAVLGAAGHAPRPTPRELPAGLTAREAEILNHVARGLTNKEVAAALGLSARTVGNHLQHVYEKIGVTTRAGATLFAMQHGLIRDA